MNIVYLRVYYASGVKCIILLIMSRLTTEVEMTDFAAAPAADFSIEYKRRQCFGGCSRCQD